MADSFIFPKLFYEAIKNADKEHQAEIYNMIMEYAFYDKLPENASPIANSFFILARPTLDRSIRIMSNNEGRHCSEYISWRKAVFERDDYTCQMCGERGTNLNAHHIKEYAKYPSLRYDIGNGITLCKKCHKKVHGKEE